jgi:hypothetical protein
MVRSNGVQGGTRPSITARVQFVETFLPVDAEGAARLQELAEPRDG